MGAWIVIGIIIAVIALISVIPIKLSIYACYNDEAQFDAELKYGFIRIKAPQKGSEKPPDAEEEQKNADQPPPGRGRVAELIRFAYDNIERIKKLIYAVLSYMLTRLIRINSIKLRLAIGVEDAMQTALIFGGISSFVFNTLGVADKHMRIDDHSVSLKPSFDEPRLFAELDTVISTNLFRAVALLLIAVRYGLPIYFKYRKRNGREK